MKPSDLNLPDVALLNYRQHKIDTVLGGKAFDREVVIIGSGPSATSYDPAKHPNAFKIALNGAIRSHLDADVWVMIEEQVWSFPWSVQLDYCGHVVLSVGCVTTDNLPNQIRDIYPLGFWLNQCLFVQRTQFTGQSLRSLRAGLVQYSAHGGVALQGIHVGEIAKGEEDDPRRPTYMYGTEFYFPNGVQHFYGDKPYVEGNAINSLCRFHIDEEFKPISGEGPYWSTPFFISSSMACRKVISQAKLNVVDMSGGLLDPQRMVNGDST